MEHAANRGNGIVGVHCRQHEMPGKRRLYSDLGGLTVTDFAHKYDVRVVTQGMF